jgi:hypothetical protein
MSDETVYRPNSCPFKLGFNFKAADERLFEELAALTKEGFIRYDKAHYV